MAKPFPFPRLEDFTDPIRSDAQAADDLLGMDARLRPPLGRHPRDGFIEAIYRGADPVSHYVKPPAAVLQHRAFQVQNTRRGRQRVGRRMTGPASSYA